MHQLLVMLQTKAEAAAKNPMKAAMDGTAAEMVKGVIACIADLDNRLSALEAALAER